MKNIFLALTLFFISTICSAETFIVDPNGFYNFTTIQDAINYSWDGDVIVVRPGTYQEKISFCGLKITLRSIDPSSEKTVESTIIKYDSSSAAVTFDSGETSLSIIDGLTIQGGYPSIYCYYSNPTIKSCTIKGDGYYSYGIEGNNASPSILDCSISTQPGSGPGILRCDGLVSGCLLTGNSQGMEQCDGVIENCIITNNSGNGIASSDAIIRNSVIVDNGGGGIRDSRGGIIENCTIAYNGFGIERGRFSSSNSLIIKNCIIAYNTSYGIDRELTSSPLAIEYNNLYGNVISNYNNIQPGVTDIHRIPEFNSRTDFHLKSQYGRWDDQAGGWIIDEVTSKCIDAGDPTDGVGQEPNPNGDRINIGAYGRTKYASKSRTEGQDPEPDCINPPQMDINKDCQVNLTDFAVFASEWLTCGYADQSDCK